METPAAIFINKEDGISATVQQDTTRSGERWIVTFTDDDCGKVIDAIVFPIKAKDKAIQYASNIVHGKATK